MERKLSLRSNGDNVELYSNGPQNIGTIGFSYSGWFDRETFERDYIQGRVGIGEYKKGVEQLCNNCDYLDGVVRIGGDDGSLKLTKINGRVVLIGIENSRAESGVIEVDLSPEEFMRLVTA